MKILDLFDNNFNINWEFVNKIPEIKALIGCKQNSQWHQEGDAYNHTVNVVNEMQKIVDNNDIKTKHVRMLLLAAALFHDIGKPLTTYFDENDGEYHSKNHGLEGARLTRILFFDEPDVYFRESLIYMVRNHMDLHYIFGKSDKYKKKLIKLSFGMVPLTYMLWLNMADTYGSMSICESPEKRDVRFKIINELMDELHIRWTNYMEYENRLTPYKELNNLVDLDIKDVNQDKESFNVYIMCGLPGSGKSTYIKENFPNLPIISRDVFRYELGLTSSPDEKIIAKPDEEKRITRLMNERIIEYCKAGKDFVIDNMNLRYTYRQAILNIALQYNAYITVIYIEAPNIETCIKRRAGQIPANEYKRLLNTIDFPMPYEYDDIIISKQTS